MRDEERDEMILQIRDNTVQLRTVVLGLDGAPGMAGDLRVVSEKVEGIERILPLLQTKMACKETHDGEAEERVVEKKARQEGKERRKLSVREWMMIALTLVMSIAAVVAIIIH